MSQYSGPDAARAEAQPGKDHTQCHSKDDHHTDTRPGMAGIIIAIQHNDGSMPQAPDHAGDNGCIDPTKRGQARQQVASPAELFTKGKNHVEENAQGESKDCLYQDVKKRQLVGGETTWQ